MDCLRQGKDGCVVILVHVQPRSSKNTVLGLYAGTLKVCTTAPPIEGKANTAIITLLAKLFEIPKSAVALKTGAKSRNKSFCLTEISLDTAVAILARSIREVD